MHFFKFIVVLFSPPLPQLFDIESYTGISEQACLQVSSKQHTYPIATRDCTAKGGHLVTTKTFEKLELVASLVGDETKVWIGLDDKPQVGVFVWQDEGQPMSDLVRQLLFRPDWNYDPSDGKNCGILRPGILDLSNTRCRAGLVYVCETKPGL